MRRQPVFPGDVPYEDGDAGGKNGFHDQCATAQFPKSFKVFETE